MHDTVSHETISAMLHGEVARWVKVECVVRQLAEWAVDARTADAEIRRFHGLWLQTQDLSLDDVTSGHDFGAARRANLPLPELPTVDERGLAREPQLLAPIVKQPLRGTPARIVGELPAQNRDFTGRDLVFDALREALITSPELPVVLYGLGGVGKTQVAIEYLYRNAADYDVVWWIPAEQPALARASLGALGDRLEVPRNQDVQQTVRTVLGELEGSGRRWLLVYDNAEDEEEVQGLLPTIGGNAILTSRNPAWAGIAKTIELNVFDRAESIQFLRKRGKGISGDDANRLAERLGDLPLALEQLAAMQAATGTSLSQYLDLLDDQLGKLLSTHQPNHYPTTVGALLRLAVKRLRGVSPTAANLFELFAHLGAEPVSVALLRTGRRGKVTATLGRTLSDPIQMRRAIRELARYGLAKLDPQEQRIEVHRVVQLWLREGLDEDARRRGRRNAHQLLAAANPGWPDDLPTWKFHAEIAPHVLPAGLINADDIEGRRVVLDQIRYLYLAGEYEGSRSLGERAVSAWSAGPDEGGLGPDHELTLLATREWANALRSLGHYAKSRELTAGVLDRLERHPAFGADHPYALATARSASADLRIRGGYRKALMADRVNLERHRSHYGQHHPHTLSVMSSLAVDMRMTGDFAAAYRMDDEVARRRRELLGDHHRLTLLSFSNLARDLYGLGQYHEALELQLGSWPAYQERLGSRHNDVLLAARTLAIALRKAGRHAEALRQAEENYDSYHGRFGADHEHTLAAIMSYANTLCVAEHLDVARNLATEAVATYRQTFGGQHPLTLAAEANLAVILRALGEHRNARAADELTLEELRLALGEEHPYTLCVASNLASGLALDHEHAAARSLLERTWITSCSVRGPHHPDTLACAANLALDRMETGDSQSGQELLDNTLTALRRAFGSNHPTVVAVALGKRIECDIEPPPS